MISKTHDAWMTMLFLPFRAILLFVACMCDAACLFIIQD